MSPRRLLLIFIALAASARPLVALNPETRISQYSHSVWRLQDGVFNGIPTAIVQTADGYLWIGTSSGLMRFDGVRFVPWTPPPEGPVLTEGVYSLGASRDGSLWIGSSVLMRWKDGKLSSYANVNGRINTILEDPAGGVWVTRSRTRDEKGPLCHISDEQVRCFGNRDGITIPYAGALFRDTSGSLWLGGSEGLARGKPGSFDTFVPPALKARSQLGGVGDIAVGPNGSILIGMVQSGPNMGLEEFNAGRWSPFTKEGLDGSALQVNDLLNDRSGSLWIGTVSQGLCVVRDGRINYFRSSDGLSSNVINDIYEDRESNIWVVTSGGLDRFSVPNVLSFSSREGLSSDYAGSVLAATDGTVWVGNHDALDEIHDGAVSSIREDQGLPGRRVTVLLQDHLGRLWVGADNTLSVRDGRRFRKLSRRDGSPVGTLQALIEDRDGDLWGIPAPSSSQLIHVHGLAAQEEAIGPAGSRIVSIVADPAGGITMGFRSGDIATFKNRTLSMTASKANGLIFQLQRTSDGHLVGLSSAKFVGWQNGTLQRLGTQNGLPCDSAFTFIVDRQGTLWLYASCGLIAIDNRELQRWWKDPKTTLAYRLFDSFDGVHAAATPFSPNASEAPDGEIWFVNSAVAQTIDPKHLSTNDLAPPVHIESLIADRKSYPLQQALRLPPLTRDLEIDYTGLSFVAPSKVLFRYMLEGYDTQWQEPGTRRAAFYNDLKPGKYTFRVIASNNSGLWNTEGASLEFNIAPAYYQTNLFRLMCAAILVALLWAFYLLRLRQMRQEFNVALEARVNERTRIARELHDTLLQSLQGLMFQFQAARNMLPRRPEDAAQTLDEAISDTEQAIAESRDAIHDLRSQPATEKDLAALLEAVAEELAAAPGPDREPPGFRVIVEGEPRKLSADLQDEVYRIAHEVLRNAFRHAGAGQIEAEIRYDKNQLRLRIRDDGKGIDPKVLEESSRPGHWGLLGVHERAQRIGSQLSFWSQAAAGTEVELTIPAAIAYEGARNGRRSKVFREEQKL
jgi:signal transduction histidine kinase/ligand-binding sensor domain-containing protein